MINDLLIWFLGVPVLLGLLVWWVTGHGTRQVPGLLLYLAISFTAIIATFLITKGTATADTEIWNGKVTSKDRQHGSYQRPYDCFCRNETSCSGTGQNRSCTSRRVCQTCYEDRYTVTWSCATTIGNFTILHLDEARKSVYSTPDPARWTSIKVGDPVAKQATYTNYVQAVPESLFTPAGQAVAANFSSLLPPYPDQVYDFYRVDRFLTPGWSLPEAAQWNAAIGDLLKDRGPAKQVNAIVVVAKTSDRRYALALRDHWEGANKNDVVLVIGSTEWPKIDFVEVISWTKRELFKVQLRDEVQALGEVKLEPVLEVLARQIDTNFERRRMREFKYLEAEINPPAWVLVTLAGLLVAGAVAQVFIYRRYFQQPSRRPSFYL